MGRIASARKARPRRRKVAPRTRGLKPADCVGSAPPELADLARRIESAGGAVAGTYRDPLGGAWLALALLPIDAVSPTPFQRDLSEAHAKRLTLTIEKLGIFLDPIIAVPVPDDPKRPGPEGAERVEGFWTPNGRHRLEAMHRAGAVTVTALVMPDAALQYKILALNVEKAHNLREKSLEVIRMARGMPASEVESAHAFEFEEPAFLTLGVCYERNGRFGGGAVQPILRRVDEFLDLPLSKSLAVREKRADLIGRLDAAVAERVKELQAKGMKSPYLKAFVIARCNPLRFMKELPPFDEAVGEILRRVERMKVDRVKPEDLASTGGAPAEEPE